MKIGLLGGTFDPIHNGHLYMARQVLEKGGLDEVWLVPAGISPNKNNCEITSPAIRAAMAAAAIGVDVDCEAAAESKLGETGTAAVLSSCSIRNPGLRVCTIEVHGSGTSYTYLTLQKLQERFPDDRFTFIMGADSLDYFERWVHPERICACASILVVNRGRFSRQQLLDKITAIKKLFPATIDILECDKFDAASHEIRENLQKGERCEKLLPPEVYQFIAERGLYGVPL